MKAAIHILVLLVGLMLVDGVHAQSPREQLKQMVEQLQKTPTDNALREKIIMLGARIKPPPAIPEEAERRMARGAAAFKGATSAAGYQEAAKEFEQATLAAPWYGDSYYNLGVAQDKAGSYEAALRSLKLAQLTSPDSKEIKTLIYEVEFRKEQASPEIRAAKQKLMDEALTRSLEGAVFTLQMGQDVEFQYRISNGRAVFWTRRTASRGPMCYDGSRRDGPIGEEGMCPDSLTIPLDGRRGTNKTQRHSATIEIAEDGQSLRIRDIWDNEAPTERRVQAPMTAALQFRHDTGAG